MSAQQPLPPAYAGFQPYVTQPGYPQQQGYASTGATPYPQQAYIPAAGAAYPPQQGFVQVGGAAYPPQQGYPPPMSPYPPQAGVNVNYVPGPDIKLDEENILESEKDSTLSWKGFSDKAIRAVFIRKVYAILMLQLVFSLGVICLFVFEKHVNLFVRRNFFVYIISYVIFLGVYIALVCCGNLRRQYPTNVYLLSIFTVAMSYMLGAISSFHETRIVLMAAGICAGVCLVVTVFSFHTKFDFTTCGGVLFVLCWVLFMFGIIAIFTYNDILKTVYAGCGALLFVAFLAYDTQMIMGGKKHELSAEEHIFAAICLYLDVVYIFMFLLMALGGGKK